MYFSSSFTLGILGGGQLCKMLLTETARLDIATAVLEDHGALVITDRKKDIIVNSAGENVSPARIEGRLTLEPEVNLMAAAHYLQALDYQRRANQIAKNEAHGFAVQTSAKKPTVAALDALAAAGKLVRPAPHIFRTVSDKTAQKRFYARHEIPTAPFSVFPGRPTVAEVGALPKVWKAATGGYDGRGVVVLEQEDLIAELPDVPCLVEDFMAGAVEIAVLVARRPSGQTAIYEPVEMVFDPGANLLDLLRCPSSLPTETVSAARRLAARVAEAFGLEGIMAVEMFATPDGDLFVNEVAPRPHNSGHHTIESHVTSQYEQHLRAILDLPLGPTTMHCPAVMLNLVGGAPAGPVRVTGVAEAMAIEGVFVHIYGKTQSRPNRKMGHVTILAPTVEAAMAKAARVRATIEVKGDG